MLSVHAAIALANKMAWMEAMMASRDHCKETKSCASGMNYKFDPGMAWLYD